MNTSSHTWECIIRRMWHVPSASDPSKALADCESTPGVSIRVWFVLNLLFGSLWMLMPRTRRLGKLKYKCGVCGQNFLFKNEFLHHEIRHSNPERQFKCDICRKSFWRKCLLTTHVKTHSGKFARSGCGWQATATWGTTGMLLSVVECWFLVLCRPLAQYMLKILLLSLYALFKRCEKHNWPIENICKRIFSRFNLTLCWTVTCSIFCVWLVWFLKNLIL